MPPGILPKLFQLQVLKLPFYGLVVNEEEMVRLKKLECFEGAFDGVKGFNTYVESLEEGGPSSLRIKIEKERWELLEWDNHDMKMVLEPLCQFIEWV